MNKNTCLFCGEDIHEEANGNRQYCDDNCYYLEKLIRQKAKREVEAENRKKKLAAESILRNLLEKYGEGNWINPLEAEEMGLDLSIGDKIQFLDGQRAIVIGQLAYIMPNISKMEIYKI